MSYCRWSDGDLYVVSGPPIMCMCCPLLENREDFSGTKVEMLAHLKEHKEAGHCFPNWAILRLEAEIEEEARTGEESSFYLRPLPCKCRD
jgi:hypothetical protein